MGILKGLNKEQLTALATAVVCVLLVLFGLAGGKSPARQGAIASQTRGYEPPKHRSSDLVFDDFKSYWTKNFTPPELTSRLSIPPLRPPEPREEELAAPFFRPGPTTEAYNKGSFKLKYPALSAAAPVAPAGDLPAQAELDALKKLEEPVQEPRKDRRGDRDRPKSVVILNNNIQRTGDILLDDPGRPLRIKDDKQTFTIPRTEIREILYNDTCEEQYRKRTGKIQPGSKEAAERTALARWAHDMGMIPETKDELALVLKAKPDHVDAVLLLGQVHIENSDYNAALAVYEAGIGAGAPAADLHYEIGRALRALGFLEGAQGSFEKAIDVAPGHVLARLALTRALLDQGLTALAVAQANTFLNTIAARAKDDQKAEGALLRGLALLRQGDAARAKPDLEAAAKIDPRGEAMNALAVIDGLDGNLRNASSGFARAIQANQYLTEAWLNLGAVLLMAAKWADAEALYAAAVQRDPASADALAGQGLAQLMAGNTAAAGTLGKALAIEAAHPQANAAMGVVNLRSNNVAGALDCFTAALRADFDFLPAYSGAAAAYLKAARVLAEKSGKDPGAEKEVQRLRVNAETLLKTVKAREANRPGPVLALGCAYAAMGRAGEALAEFSMASFHFQQLQKPPDPLVFYGQGYVEYYFGAGNDEQRLALARGHFASGEQVAAAVPDWARTVEECKRAREAIEDWLATSVRVEEDFEREASATVGNNWLEADGNFGIDITLERFPNTGGRVKFSGRQAIQNMGVTSLQRDIPSEDFQSLEITFIPDKVAKTEYGFSILTNVAAQVRSGFHWGVDLQGKPKFVANLPERELEGKDMSVHWADMRMALPDPAQVTVRVVKSEKNRAPVLSIFLRDHAKGEWVPGPQSVPFIAVGAQGQPWRLSIWGRAWQNQEYTFFVDNVRVLEKAKR